PPPEARDLLGLRSLGGEGIRLRAAAGKQEHRRRDSERTFRQCSSRLPRPCVPKTEWTFEPLQLPPMLLAAVLYALRACTLRRRPRPPCGPRAAARVVLRRGRDRLGGPVLAPPRAALVRRRTAGALPRGDVVLLARALVRVPLVGSSVLHAVRARTSHLGLL